MAPRFFKFWLERHGLKKIIQKISRGFILPHIKFFRLLGLIDTELIYDQVNWQLKIFGIFFPQVNYKKNKN